MSERFYTPEALAELTKEQLETIVDARGLRVEGSGADGNVLVDDLVEAIQCHQDQAGINPALERAPELNEPVERDYKVVGPHPVLGHKPGSKFRAALPLEQEASLIEAGHIARQDTPRGAGGSTGGGQKPSSTPTGQKE